MAILRCTKKLLSELKTRPVDSGQSAIALFSWHANLLRIDRRKCVLFSHDQTLYTFIYPLGKPIISHLFRYQGLAGDDCSVALMLWISPGTGSNEGHPRPSLNYGIRIWHQKNRNKGSTENHNR